MSVILLENIMRQLITQVFKFYREMGKIFIRILLQQKIKGKFFDVEFLMIF